MTDDAATDLLNEALVHISLEQNWPWMHTTQSATTDGTASITLATAVRSVESVTIGNDPYYPMSVGDLDSAAASGFGRRGYTIRDRTLTLYPTPGSGKTVTVRGLAFETVLSGASDEPLLPDQYVPILVELAAALWHEQDPQGNANAAVHEVRYQRLMTKLRRVATMDARPVLPSTRAGSLV